MPAVDNSDILKDVLSLRKALPLTGWVVRLISIAEDDVEARYEELQGCPAFS